MQTQTQLSAQADSLDQGHDYDYSVATAERAAQTTCRHNLMAQCSDGRLSSVTFGKTFYGEKKNEQGRTLYHATSTCSGACVRSQAAP